jgi:hypothetical protein
VAAARRFRESRSRFLIQVAPALLQVPSGPSGLRRTLAAAPRPGERLPDAGGRPRSTPPVRACAGAGARAASGRPAGGPTPPRAPASSLMGGRCRV